MLKINSVAAALNVSSSGTYCALSCPITLGAGGVSEGIDVFDSGYYIVQTGSGVSAGSITLQLLTYSPAANPVWVTATTPNSPSGAAFILIPSLAASTVYNGSLGVSGGVFFPCHGMRLVLSGLTGGNVTVMQLTLTKR